MQLFLFLLSYAVAIVWSADSTEDRLIKASNACASSRSSASLFIANDVLINKSDYFVHDAPIGDLCDGQCHHGTQYSYEAHPFGPETIWRGSLVAADLNCTRPSELCLQTTDGRLWQGFGSNESALFATIFIDCPRDAPVCVARAIIDGYTDQTPGVQEVGGSRVVTIRDNYDENDQYYAPLSQFDYLRVVGVACNSCAHPLSYCSRPRIEILPKTYLKRVGALSSRRQKTSFSESRSTSISNEH